MDTLQSNPNTKARKDHQCNFCYGVISKGEIYNSSVHVHYGDIYSWKSHKKCQDIAHELDMYECGEGLTGEDFQACIFDAYQAIQIEENLEHYESKDFKYPPDKDILEIVIEAHKKQLK